jgi:hypothetical protein
MFRYRLIFKTRANFPSGNFEAKSRISRPTPNHQPALEVDFSATFLATPMISCAAQHRAHRALSCARH